MLAVLGGLADVERDLIRTHTAEGRSRAEARGKHMGRPASLTPAQQKEAIRRRWIDGATLQELADSYDRSIATMHRATRAAGPFDIDNLLITVATRSKPCRARSSMTLSASFPLLPHDLAPAVHRVVQPAAIAR
jgi:hypothetical protein